MTLDKFDWLATQACKVGKFISKCTVSGWGSEEEEEVYELEGFLVTYRDDRFFWMNDKNGNSIRREDCTTFNVSDMSNDDLKKLVSDVQKVIKKREMEGALKAINEFTTAWDQLKKFGEVRVRISATGEKHFHTTVDKLGIEFLPLN